MGFTEPLPRLACRRSALPALTAEARSSFWKTRESVLLRDVITGAAPVQPTSVRVAWDADELRVLFCAEDTHIHATLTARDAPLYTEEVVEVFLDPAGDGACYFEIEVNPLNAVLDLVLRRNRGGWRKDFAWRCEDLRTCVRREAAALSAELAIPFRSPASRSRFDLVTMNNLYSISPYWKHQTMDCHEAARQTRKLTAQLLRDRVSLDAALFYKSVLMFDPALRPELLDLQTRAWERGWWVRKLFDVFHAVTDYFFGKDLRRFLKSQACANSTLAALTTK